MYDNPQQQNYRLWQDLVNTPTFWSEDEVHSPLHLQVLLLQPVQLL